MFDWMPPLFSPILKIVPWLFPMLMVMIVNLWILEHAARVWVKFTGRNAQPSGEDSSPTGSPSPTKSST